MRPYFAAQDYFLGFSYALGAAFSTWAGGQFFRQRLAALAAGAVGSIGLVGVIMAGRCFLLGCCGSPMLGVYLALFEAKALGAGNRSWQGSRCFWSFATTGVCPGASLKGAARRAAARRGPVLPPGLWIKNCIRLRRRAGLPRLTGRPVFLQTLLCTVMPHRPRSTSITPSSCSILARPWLTADWASPIRSAAGYRTSARH